jgi:hypothetical protein
MRREVEMVDATWREWSVRLRIRDRASVVGSWALGVVSCSIAFAGCGSDDQSPAAATPVGIVGVYEAIEFYPACGNETLNHQGVTWYTLVPVGFDLPARLTSNPGDADRQNMIDEVFAVARAESPVAGRYGLKVVPPGPGDDIGTLVVWADGVARWVSDSRNLDVWMIDDPIRYIWAC